jgi:hypothetical protein
MIPAVIVIPIIHMARVSGTWAAGFISMGIGIIKT